MVKIMKNPIKIDDLGGFPLFLETSTYLSPLSSPGLNGIPQYELPCGNHPHLEQRLSNGRDSRPWNKIYTPEN